MMMWLIENRWISVHLWQLLKSKAKRDNYEEDHTLDNRNNKTLNMYIMALNASK